MAFTATHLEDAALVLSDGEFFIGKGVGIKGVTEGEICFNTGLSGYQETLTDPSFAGQLITFTFPHIGNVGTNVDDAESKIPACKGLIIREPITSPSNYRSQQSLHTWLVTTNMIGISGVDTRALTRSIRTKGARHAMIMHATPGEVINIDAIVAKIKDTPTLLGKELTHTVTTPETYIWPGSELGEYTVVAIDYGCKNTILSLLAAEGLKVVVVPATASFSQISKYRPDGVFLSNGPGDPEETHHFSGPVIREIVASKIPLFGICLGHQLLGLAMGLKTEKMKKGHRGCNQPVLNLETKRVLITSQNHGFCVTDTELTDSVEVTYRSLFDNSIEGIRIKNYPAFSVQFHPESSPGPHDARPLFSEFKTLIESRSSQVKRGA